MVERIEFNGKVYAIIVSHKYSEPGVNFFTNDDFSQQVAFIKHPKDTEIKPHVHNLFVRDVHFTNEALVIRKGKLRVDFYDEEQQYRESRILTDGDMILLAGGGHGFEVLEETEMYEIKQGPYAGDRDKTRFPAHRGELVIVEK